MRNSRDIRWRPCLNLSGYDGPGEWYGEDKVPIPPYSLVALRYPCHFTSHPQDGQEILHVRRPGLFDQQLQNPAMLAVTGPQEIPYEGIGVCTQDWPAMVRVNRTGEQGPYTSTGSCCGPVANSFEAGSTGNCFTIIGYSSSRPLQNDWDTGVPGTTFGSLLTKSGPQIAWISPPGRPSPVARMNSYGGLDEPEPLQLLRLISEYAADLSGLANPNRTMYYKETSRKYDTIVLKAPGVYMFGFSGTLDTVDYDYTHGEVLQVSAMISGSINSQVIATGFRTAWKIEDEYSGMYKSAENVAFSGVFDAENENVQFVLINYSDVKIRISQLALWMMPMTGFLPAQTFLTYPNAYI